MTMCAVERRRSSVGAIPTRQLSLQPVAIETIGEVTNRSELSMERAVIDGPANRQAVTCVNAEQASKVACRGSRPAIVTGKAAVMDLARARAITGSMVPPG